MAGLKKPSKIESLQQEWQSDMAENEGNQEMGQKKCKAQ